VTERPHKTPKAGWRTAVRFRGGQLRAAGLWKDWPLAVPTMHKNQSNRGKSADSASGSFTSQEDDGPGRANESQYAGGEAVAGAPAQNGDCNATYESQRHNFSDRGASNEASPSAGWRSVFYEMGVQVR